MARVRRIAVVAVVGFLLYCFVLWGAGFVLRGWIKGQARARVAAAFDADVVIERVEVNLLTGSVALHGLRISRHKVGAVEIRVAHATARLAPLGLAAFDRDVRRATVRGVDIAVDAAGLAELPRRRRPPLPLRIADFRLEEARVAVSPTSLLPGLGRVTLRVQEARARQVSLRDGLTWLLHLRELHADLALPNGATVGVAYEGKQLALSGSVFGSAALEVEFTMPDADTDGYELGSLVTLGKALLKPISRELLARELTRRLRD